MRNISAGGFAVTSAGSGLETPAPEAWRATPTASATLAPSATVIAPCPMILMLIFRPIMTSSFCDASSAPTHVAVARFQRSAAEAFLRREQHHRVDLALRVAGPVAQRGH